MAPQAGSTESFGDLSPLLGRAHSPSCLLPDISLAISALVNTPANEIDCEQFNIESCPTEVLQTAYKLLVLLELRHRKLRKLVHTDDIFEAWSCKNTYTREAKILEEKAVTLWISFLQNYRNNGEIQTVLWSQFPTQHRKIKFLRVIDFLVDHDSPASIVSHPITMLSLTYTWERGNDQTPSGTPGTQPRLGPYDTFANPQSLHFIELVSHIGFLTILSHYLLHPYEKPHTWNTIFEHFGWREYSLVFLPFSFVVYSGPRSGAIPLLVPFTFFLSFPFPPSPGDISFTILLWIFFIHFLQLYLPSSPSPCFLFSRQYTLPFVIFLSRRLSTLLYPIILLFLPTFLLTSFLLSISLADTFGRLLMYQTTYRNYELPSPPETRLALLIFLVTVIGIVTFSIFALATTPEVQAKSSQSWDQYSEHNGLAARKSFYCIIRLHSGVYVFPPPFNILYLFCIQAPEFILQTQLPRLEKMLWRASVGPFMIFSTLLFSLGKAKKYPLFRRRYRATREFLD